jgi:large subunit ribosomal protein L22
MKAALNNYRQSPRKVALVAGLIRGKTAAEALRSLQFTVKRASDPVLKLLESAIANARNAGISDVESLIVKEIQVNKGVTLKRIMPRARGSASRINKRSSHVTIILAEAAPKVSLKKPKAAKKATASSKIGNLDGSLCIQSSE